MTFLQPFLLTLAVLISVPFIIHLTGERKYRPQLFSSLKFLREIERDSLQKLKLRQWLILLSRALALAMLVLALARPFLSGAAGALDPGILLTDSSFSVIQNTAHDEMLRNIRASFPRWHSISYTEHTDPDSLRNRLLAHIADHRITAPRIIMISDLQDNLQNRAITATVEQIARRDFYVRPENGEANAAVKELKIFRDPESPADMFILDIRVSRRPADAEVFPLRVTVNGKELGRAAVDRGGHAEFRFEPGNTPNLRCAVSTAPDARSADNTRYLAARTYPELRLLCVDDHVQKGYHVNAFRAMENIRLRMIGPGELPSVDLEDFDIVWLAEPYAFPERQMEAILQYAGEHPLVLVAGDNIPGSYPLEGDVRVRDLRPGFVNILSAEGGSAPLPADKKNFRIFRYYQNADTSLDVLWTMSNGDPLLARKGENLYVFFSPFRFDWNGMGLSPYFTRVLGNLLRRMPGEQKLNYHSGEAISADRPRFEITLPSGEKRRVHGSFRETRRPGFYSIDTGDSSYVAAVNIPPGECEQSRIATDPDKSYTAEGGDIRGLVRDVRGKNLQTLFFVIAALFIMFEMILLFKGEKT